MPKISVNLRDVTEPQPVPPGEYGLTISTAEYIEEKNYILVSLGIDEHPDAPNVRHYVSLPKEDDEPAKANMKGLMMKRFLQTFDIEADDEIDTDDWPGQQADVELVLSEPDDNGNIYNRLKLPRLKNEEDGEKAPPARRPAAKAPPARRR